VHDLSFPSLEDSSKPLAAASTLLDPLTISSDVLADGKKVQGAPKPIDLLVLYLLVVVCASMATSGPYGMLYMCCIVVIAIVVYTGNFIVVDPAALVCSVNKINGTASARTSDPGASVGRIVSRRIWIKTSISGRSGEARVQCCEKLVRCCGSYYSMLRTSSVQHPTREVSIDVASLCVSCCERQGSQHSVFRGKIAQGRTGSLPPPGLAAPAGGEGGAKVLCSP
jgi:hypothetical protein